MLRVTGRSATVRFNRAVTPRIVESAVSLCCPPPTIIAPFSSPGSRRYCLALVRATHSSGPDGRRLGYCVAVRTGPIRRFCGVRAHQVTADGRAYSDESIALAALKPHPTGVGAWGFSVPAPRAARHEGARAGAARRWLRPAKQPTAAASPATAAAHVCSSAAAPSASASAAAPATAAKAARGAAKAARAVGKAARAAAKEARWVVLSAALAQRGAPAAGERVQGKYQV